jgi:hypothetical protein
MKKMTEKRMVQLLSKSAARRYGEEHAKSLSPALRETAKAIAVTKNRALALEEEPAFFSR